MISLFKRCSPKTLAALTQSPALGGAFVSRLFFTMFLTVEVADLDTRFEGLGIRSVRGSGVQE